MDSRAEVERMVRNYQEMRREMEMLQASIGQFLPVSELDVLETLTFLRPDGTRIQDDAISEKTARIAAIYREIAGKVNEEALRGMVQEYHHCKSQVDFIDFCLPRLKPRLSAVMIDLVQKGLTWPEVCETYHVSYTTLARYRKAALDELVRWYDLRFACFVVQKHAS